MICLKLVQVSVPRANAWRQGQTSFSTFMSKINIAVPKIRTVYYSPGIATGNNNGRLKREDLRHTKFDSPFSTWEVLIGPTDWSDCAMGKPGAERYRKQNLASCTRGPGVYQIAVPTLWPRVLLPEPSKVHIPSIKVLPTYLGVTKNVKNRLQQYGRYGAHLENGCVNPGIFSDIFSMGLPILVRVAPMDNKEKAQNFEHEQLQEHDYAWNEKKNGKRRHHEILAKLDQLYSKD